MPTEPNIAGEAVGANAAFAYAKKIWHQASVWDLDEPDDLCELARHLEAFAQQERAEEREECAKVADAHFNGSWELSSRGKEIGAAIRARGEKG